MTIKIDGVRDEKWIITSKFSFKSERATDRRSVTLMKMNCRCFFITNSSSCARGFVSYS